MSNEPTSEVVQPWSIVGGILSYLIPGLGQIYQGRVSKGLMFMVCLLSLFHVGEAMGNWQNVYVPPVPDDNAKPQQSISGRLYGILDKFVFRYRQYAGQFWIGMAAWPAIWQHNEGPMPSEQTSPFLHNYQKYPNETLVNTTLVNSDKTPDLGWIYTVIAGMLNILVIYDAFAGPAYGARMGAGAARPAGEAGS
jgi:hypothetical protein